jgi:ABC-2 type transport system permease protein
MIFYSLLHNGKNRKEIFIRSLFFLVILFIFSKLWQATQFSDGGNWPSMIWYLSVTELIVLSVPFIQIDIENDIRSGDVAYQLLKPIHYLWLKIADSIGAFLFRFTVLMIIAIPTCAYLSGYIPPPSILLLSYLTAGIAGLVFILFQTAIGLLAFKLHDATPIFWVWQRCSFLFGGLVIPLDFYPSFLKTASYFLPFASLLYGPASLILSFNAQDFLFVLGGLLFWGVAAVLLANGLYIRMLKSLKINGG